MITRFHSILAQSANLGSCYAQRKGLLRKAIRGDGLTNEERAYLNRMLVNMKRFLNDI